MRVLGIDPGSRYTGLGIVESTTDEIVPVFSDCIRTGSRPMFERLGEIYRQVGQTITRYQPDVVAVEQVFFSVNPRSALVLGQARGSAICSAVSQERQVVEYTALQIKRAVVGNGNAKKEQVQHMVRVLLGLTHTPGTDESDALACAICHIHTAQIEHKLKLA